MKFTKMHGLGNDYIYVNGFEERIVDAPKLARCISDRHVGVGGDGLIIIHPSRQADVRMEMYNADGSRAEMCGNGIRCVSKFVVDHGLMPGSGAVATDDARTCEVRVETDAGVRRCQCRIVDGVVRTVRVDMGQPLLDPASLPAKMAADRIVDYPLRLDSADRPVPANTDMPPAVTITCVSMGNPHAVVFVDDLECLDLDRIGPLIERAPQFPNRINAHFVRVDSLNHVTMKTWERGSGPTRACGTGACAVCVAGAVTKRTGRMITATLPGGDLELEWADDDHVYMTGPAVEVFSGEWPG